MAPHSFSLPPRVAGFIVKAVSTFDLLNMATLLLLLCLRVTDVRRSTRNTLLEFLVRRGKNLRTDDTSDVKWREERCSVSAWKRGSVFVLERCARVCVSSSNGKPHLRIPSSLHLSPSPPPSSPSPAASPPLSSLHPSLPMSVTIADLIENGDGLSARAQCSAAARSKACAGLRGSRLERERKRKKKERKKKVVVSRPRRWRRVYCDVADSTCLWRVKRGKRNQCPASCLLCGQQKKKKR